MQLTSSRSERGIAMILALMALVVVGGIGMLLFTRSLNEIRHSSDDTAIVQTLMLARGGANVGAILMGTDVSDRLHDVVEATSRPGRWAYGVDQSPMTDDGPDPISVIERMDGIAREMQDVVDSLVCNQSVLPEAGSEVNLRIYFTDRACGENLPISITLADGRFVDGVPRGGSLEGIQTYALPVVMVSEAVMGDFRRNIVIQGEYVFDVGQTSFAHYAYFTNRESATGSRIWFTEETIIDGPTHTNSNFSFYSTPWFGGRVTSAGCRNKECTGTRNQGAYFYNSSSRVTSPGDMRPNMNQPNHGGHAPRFTAGVQWNGAIVELPTSAYSQELVARGVDRPDDVGLVFEESLDHLHMWAGDHLGNQLSQSGSSWGPAATWQYVQACDERTERVKVADGYWQYFGQYRYWVDRPVYEDVQILDCETWRFNEDGLFQQLREGGELDEPSDWISESSGRTFNGVIFVEGGIERLRGPDRLIATSDNADSAPPAIAAFAQITVTTTRDIRITRDLKYEQPPCIGRPTKDRHGNVTPADCNNLDQLNVLGVYSVEGDIIVGSDNYVGSGSSKWDFSLNAPENVNVHAVLMSGSEQIRVEGYAKDGGNGSFDRDMGNFYLLGGMIQENRGVFGTFGSGSRKGYDRVYTYDPRMMRGLAPPFFPTTGLGEVTFAAFFSFGQREQVY